MEDSIIPNEVILNKIHFIRQQKVMLDKDLAELYDVVRHCQKMNSKIKIFKQN